MLIVSSCNFVNKRDERPGEQTEGSLVARTVTSERRAMKSPVAIRWLVLEALGNKGASETLKERRLRRQREKETNRSLCNDGLETHWIGTKP